MHAGGKCYEYWRASWVDLNGEEAAKYFSLAKHGSDAAFKLACTHREQAMEALNKNGAGYTMRHLQISEA